MNHTSVSPDVPEACAWGCGWLFQLLSCEGDSVSLGWPHKWQGTPLKMHFSISTCCGPEIFSKGSWLLKTWSLGSTNRILVQPVGERADHWGYALKGVVDSISPSPWPWAASTQVHRIKINQSCSGASRLWAKRSHFFFLSWSVSAICYSSTQLTQAPNLLG